MERELKLKVKSTLITIDASYSSSLMSVEISSLKAMLKQVNKKILALEERVDGIDMANQGYQLSTSCPLGSQASRSSYMIKRGY